MVRTAFASGVFQTHYFPAIIVVLSQFSVFNLEVIWTEFLLGHEFNSFHEGDAWENLFPPISAKHCIRNRSICFQMHGTNPDYVLRVKSTVLHILWWALPFAKTTGQLGGLHCNTYSLHIVLHFLKSVMLEGNLCCCKPQSPDAQRKGHSVHPESTMLLHPSSCYGTFKVTFRCVVT